MTAPDPVSADSPQTEEGRWLLAGTAIGDPIHFTGTEPVVIGRSDALREHIIRIERAAVRDAARALRDEVELHLHGRQTISEREVLAAIDRHFPEGA